MIEDRNHKLEELYHRGRKLDDEERRRFLDLECAGDPELREQLTRMFAISESRGILRRLPTDQSDLGDTDFELHLASLTPGPMARANLPNIGDRVEKYEILDTLGEGGMGAVFLARDTELGRAVAIKFMLSDDPRLSDRFKREAQATAQCGHENIVVIYEVGEHRGNPFMVLEYLKGRTLRQWLHDTLSLPAPLLDRRITEFAADAEHEPHALTPRRAVAMMIPVVRALVCAHGLNIVHRDLKPENIIVTDAGLIKVLDFGIAKHLSPGEFLSTNLDAQIRESNRPRTSKTAILGTLPYMSPEQWDGRPTPASDLWAVGIMLYEVVIGRHPLAPLSEAKLVSVADCSIPMPSAAQARPALGALGHIIDRCLAKDEAHRVASSEELLALLEAFRYGRDGGRLHAGGSKLHGPGFLWGVPSLPLHYLERHAEQTRLTETLLGRSASGGARVSGLCGMGGIGKTVLAAAMVQSSAVRERFANGVFWLTIGQDSNIVALQTQLAHALDADQPNFANAADGKRWLTHALADQRVLLILDDVWDLEQAAALDVVGDSGALMITTRNRGILALMDAEVFPMDLLPEGQALALLGTWVGKQPDALPPRAADVARACGYLPLALAMVGAMVRSDVADWADVLELLQRAELKQIEQQLPEYPYRDLLRVFDVSVGFLDTESQRRYLDLAVFPVNEPIPEAVLEMMWTARGLGRVRIRMLIKFLVARSLAVRDGDRHIRLHNLHYVYLCRQMDDFAALHRELIAAYAARCSGGFASGPDDGYYFQWLPHHLAAAGQPEPLRALLTRYDWIDAKLRATSVSELIADFALVADPTPQIELLRDALRLSSHVLARHPEQLPYQLLGRLAPLATAMEPGGPLRELIAEARRVSGSLGLFPIRVTFTPPGGPLLLSLAGHTSTTSAVAVTPDGRRAISASTDATLKVWDLETGDVLRTLRGHAGPVTAIATTWRLGLSASEDHTLRVWDVDSGGVVRVLSGHETEVSSVAITPNGRYAIAACWDGALRVWYLRSERGVRTLRGHTGRVHAVAVTADAAWIVSGGDDCSVKVWSLSDGALHRSLEGHEKPVIGVAITPDGQRILSVSEDRTLGVWDRTSGRSLRTMRGHVGPILGVAVTPDGRRALTASFDKLLKLWDLDTGEVCLSLAGHSSAVTDVAITPDGQRAVSSSKDRTLRVWDLRTHRDRTSPIPHAKEVVAIAATPDGQRALSGSDDCTIKLWDLRTGQQQGALRGHEQGISDLCVSADGRRAVSASYDCTACVWDLETSAVTPLVGHSEMVSAVAITPDSRRVISTSKDRTLKVWDADTGADLGTLTGHRSFVSGVLVSRDGKWAVSASWDKTLKIWDLVDLREVRSLSGHTSIITSIALTPDQRRIVSASRDQTIRVWDMKSGETLHVLSDHTQQVTGVAMLADAERVVSCSFDKTLKVWSVSSGRELYTLTGHEGPVQSVAVTPDGAHLVSTSEDETLRVWDATSYRHVATFVNEGSILATDIAARGNWVIAGDQFGRVQILQIAGRAGGTA